MSPSEQEGLSNGRPEPSGSEPARKRRRKASTSPTQRALAECKKRGWIAQVVEHTVPRVFIKRDLFGVIDIVAITPAGILGIQATSGSNHASRREKIRAEPRALAWLHAGALLAVWTFAKRGERGKRKLWALREEPITAALFAVARETETSTREQLAFAGVGP